MLFGCGFRKRRNGTLSEDEASDEDTNKGPSTRPAATGLIGKMTAGVGAVGSAGAAGIGAIGSGVRKVGTGVGGAAALGVGAGVGLLGAGLGVVGTGVGLVGQGVGLVGKGVRDGLGGTTSDPENQKKSLRREDAKLLKKDADEAAEFALTFKPLKCVLGVAAVLAVVLPSLAFYTLGFAVCIVWLVYWERLLAIAASKGVKSVTSWDASIQALSVTVDFARGFPRAVIRFEDLSIFNPPGKDGEKFSDGGNCKFVTIGEIFVMTSWRKWRKPRKGDVIHVKHLEVSDVTVTFERDHHENINFHELLSMQLRSKKSFKLKASAYNGPPLNELLVTVVRAENLKAMDATTFVNAEPYSDPRVVVKYMKAERKTKTIQKNCNPSYNETFKFAADEIFSCVVFTVEDVDFTSGPDFIGECFLPLAELVDGKEFTLKTTLFNHGEGCSFTVQPW
jgi:hypothetical protein